MEYPKISLVTVSLNSKQYIEACILSVLEQNYPSLEYIVVDGGSTDGTLDIIQKYSDRISVIISEPDSGPADAINKGFSHATGEIMGWLNSDDLLHRKSLFAVAQIFESLEQVEWIMGFPTWFNADGSCVNEIYYQPDKFFYSPKFISDNLYLKFARWSKWRFAMGDFSAIQQESVFWRTSLWEKAGTKLTQNTIAHDLELWTRFFKHTNLYTANVVLAGFRVHGNQVSVTNRDRYAKESQQFIDAFKEELFKGNFENKLRTAVARFMKFFYYYDFPLLKNIYPYLLYLPPHIIYDIKEQRFVLAE